MRHEASDLPSFICHAASDEQAGIRKYAMHVNLIFRNFPTSVRKCSRSTTNSEGPVSKHRTNTGASRGSGSMMQGTDVQNKCARNEVSRTEQTAFHVINVTFFGSRGIPATNSSSSDSAKMSSPQFARFRGDSNVGSCINFHRNPRRTNSAQGTRAAVSESLVAT